MKNKLFDVFGIIAGVILIIWNLPVLLAFLLVIGIGHLLSTPKRRHNRLRVRNEIKNKLLPEGIHGYLWYDRNDSICEYLETIFIPKYENSLIISFGLNDKSIVTEKYQELLEYIGDVSEYGDANERNEEIEYESEFDGACLYTFEEQGTKILKWPALFKNGTNETDIEKTKIMFEREFKRVLDQIKK
jgi:hypothetical protein